eukprot:RCo006207
MYGTMTTRLLAMLLVLAALCTVSLGSACNITGFEIFCSYWNACQEAPSTSASQNGQCLYTRVVGAFPTSTVDSLPLSGSYRRVVFIQGPDAAIRAAGRHCTPEGRGRMLLSVGWTSPNVKGMFAFTVFVLPCATLEPIAPASVWTLASAPISAAWSGVRLATEIAYGNTAANSVWDAMT